MSTQPEALRLADELEDMTCLWSPSVNRARVDKATVELRRLHQFSEDQIGRATAAEAALQMTKATHALKIAAVEAQRDALLAVVNKLEYSSDGCIKRYPEESEVNAAIAKAEGQ